MHGGRYDKFPLCRAISFPSPLDFPTELSDKYENRFESYQSGVSVAITRAITARKLAADLGLAQATVSMALRDHPAISATTRRRVQEAARRCHYRPSRVARAMRLGRTFTVGVIVPNFAVSYIPAIVDAVEDEAKRGGYQCLICQSHASEASFRREVDVLIEQRVDGLVILPFGSAVNHEAYALLQAQSVPFVIADMEMPAGLEVDTVTNDNRLIGRLAAEHLLALGHRRIAFLRGWSGSLNALRRLEGYRLALERHGLAFDERLVVDDARPGDDGYCPVAELLARKADVTAVVAVSSDHIAVRAMRALQARGLHVPSAVSVIGCGNHDYSALVSPSLTTIDQDAAGQGRAAFALLARRMQGQGAPEARVVPVAVVVRESTMPARDVSKPAGRLAAQPVMSAAM